MTESGQMSAAAGKMEAEPAENPFLLNSGGKRSDQRSAVDKMKDGVATGKRWYGVAKKNPARTMQARKLAQSVLRETKTMPVL